MGAGEALEAWRLGGLEALEALEAWRLWRLGGGEGGSRIVGGCWRPICGRTMLVRLHPAFA
jgi:hypothetical protein